MLVKSQTPTGSTQAFYYILSRDSEALEKPGQLTARAGFRQLNATPEAVVMRLQNLPS